MKPNYSLYTYIFLFVSITFFFSCNFNKKTESKADLLKKILKSEIKIESLENKKVYVIQDNSCTMCYDNLKDELNSIDNSNVFLIFISKNDNGLKEDLSFLGLNKLPENQIYQSNNRDLSRTLLESVGGFSKGYYYIEMLKNGDIKIDAKQ